jgi:hypothetical protein
MVLEQLIGSLTSHVVTTKMLDTAFKKCEPRRIVSQSISMEGEAIFAHLIK